MGRLESLKIVLKAGLKRVPIFGWGMQHFYFLFLHRNWDADQLYVERLVSHLLVCQNYDPVKPNPVDAFIFI